MVATDPCFDGLLRETASLWRPEVGVSERGTPRNPMYQLHQEDVGCAVQPVSGTFRATVMGRLEKATHVAYLHPTEVRPGDLLAREVAVGELHAPAEAGDETLTLREAGLVCAGERVRLGQDLVVVAATEGTGVLLSEPLSSPAEEGAQVQKVVAYEVVDVRDEAGMGHHTRLGLRELSL